MSTAARKARKRTRRTLLDAGMTGVAEAYRFQHPRKVGTPGRHDPMVTPSEIRATGSLIRRFVRSLTGARA